MAGCLPCHSGASWSSERKEKKKYAVRSDSREAHGHHTYTAMEEAPEPSCSSCLDYRPRKVLALLRWSAGQPHWAPMMEHYKGQLPGKPHQPRAGGRTPDPQQPVSPVEGTPGASEACISRATKLQMHTHPGRACKMTVSLGGAACPEACLRELMLLKHGSGSPQTPRWKAYCFFPPCMHGQSLGTQAVAGQQIGDGMPIGRLCFA